ncbi:MAG TPA: MFS transporter [Thermomicrobiales bacterium]|nr:MFS transporter [Thermomicrobiales bacterium]
MSESPRRRFGGLWRQPEFLKLWAGQTVSLFGSQVTSLALPLVAVLTLGASPAEMGLLRACQTLPPLLLGVFVGAWVDRLRRRPILLGADLGRAACLALIPLAAALGLLRIELLYGVGFLAGALKVWFDITYFSYLPALVERERLIDANGKLETSFSAATIGGPGLAGALVQLVTAPFAIVLDAASFLVSALSLALIRAPEPPPAPRARARRLWGEIGAGLRAVAGDPYLRSLALVNALVNVALGLQGAIYVLYLVRDLALSPAAIGLVLAASGPGFLAGALLAARVTGRFGPGPALVGAGLVFGATRLVAPLVAGPPAVAALLLAVANLASGVTGEIHALTDLSLRQTLVPYHLLGRVNAGMRLIAWSAAPAAGLLGGALGGWLGLRPALGATALLAFLMPLAVWRSPLRALREMPQPAEPTAAP